MAAGRVQITIRRPVAKRVAADLIALAREMINMRRYREAATLAFVAGKLLGTKVPLRPYTPRE